MCSTRQDAGVSVTAHDPQSVLAAIEGSDRFLVQQVFKPIGNEYRISIPAPGSTEEGEPPLYVKQKRLKIKEDIRFRLSPDDGRHLFMIKSKTVFEFRGRHQVLDELDQPIGLLEKVFGLSLLRSHWRVRDRDGNELLEAHEASWVTALIRRFADLGPDWLSLLTWIPFNFVLQRNGEEVGTYKRVLGKLRDRYVLELGEGSQGVDRRLILAFAAALAVVAEQDGYGYDVLRRLRAAGLTEVGDASVYGTLRRLYRAGALTSYVMPSDEGPHRRYYGITERGRAQLEEARAVWTDFCRALTTLLETNAEVTA